jgi:hypothetical protein
VDEKDKWKRLLMRERLWRRMWKESEILGVCLLLLLLGRLELDVAEEAIAEIGLKEIGSERASSFELGVEVPLRE